MNLNVLEHEKVTVQIIPVTSLINSEKLLFIQRKLDKQFVCIKTKLSELLVIYQRERRRKFSGMYTGCVL